MTQITRIKTEENADRVEENVGYPTPPDEAGLKFTIMSILLSCPILLICLHVFNLC